MGSVGTPWIEPPKITPEAIRGRAEAISGSDCPRSVLLCEAIVRPLRRCAVSEAGGSYHDPKPVPVSSVPWSFCSRAVTAINDYRFSIANFQSGPKAQAAHRALRVVGGD